jgi:BirA family transcriptional regulator, biotin operon repressor / biotin---[acetyl-CoA-carboxylase] ligase
MAYNLAALDSSLAGTPFAGRIHFAPSTGSTNTDALQAARNGAPHGSVYLANQQTAGRGRGGHGWQSNVGQGLYVSVLLRPALPAMRLPFLPLAAGLAAVHAIRHASGLFVDLRWPNDLLIGLRKTGGILVESKTEAGAVAYAVIGVGINVHQTTFPPDLATPATSLDLAAGIPSDSPSSDRWVSRQALLVALLKSLEREMHLLSDPDAANCMPSRIELASTWIRGRRVHVHGPQACTGITEGLDEHGFLRVRTALGLVRVQTGGIRSTETA